MESEQNFFRAAVVGLIVLLVGWNVHEQRMLSEAATQVREAGTALSTTNLEMKASLTKVNQTLDQLNERTWVEKRKRDLAEINSATHELTLALEYSVHRASEGAVTSKKLAEREPVLNSISDELGQLANIHSVLVGDGASGILPTIIKLSDYGTQSALIGTAGAPGVLPLISTLVKNSPALVGTPAVPASAGILGAPKLPGILELVNLISAKSDSLLGDGSSGILPLMIAIRSLNDPACDGKCTGMLTLLKTLSSAHDFAGDEGILAKLVSASRDEKLKQIADELAKLADKPTELDRIGPVLKMIRDIRDKQSVTCSLTLASPPAGEEQPAGSHPPTISSPHDLEVPKALAPSVIGAPEGEKDSKQDIQR